MNKDLDPFDEKPNASTRTAERVAWVLIMLLLALAAWPFLNFILMSIT